MAQVQMVDGGVVVAFRPPLIRSKKVVAAKPHETGTVILFTGTRYERRVEAAEQTGPEPAEADLAHS